MLLGKPSRSSFSTTQSRSLRAPRRKSLRILDFDIETRLVGFYQAGKFKPQGSEPIAIAGCFIGSTKMHVWLQPEYSVPEMLERFRALWDEADMVTGHYILKFDLPLLNGALFEHSMPLLDEKDVSDTKTHLVHFEGLSKAQENLSETLRLYEEKYHMNDPRWRSATRFTPEGIKRTHDRVTADVKQHIELRAKLIEVGALCLPVTWRGTRKAA